MYVCICNAINCRTVRGLVDQGADTVGAVFRAQGCAVRCGRCVPTVRDMIRDHVGTRPANTPGSPPSAPPLPVAAE